MGDVDLESLAAGYAHRPPSPESLEWAAAAWAASPGQRGDVAVDVGGGRGRHAAVWVGAGARAVVVDPAEGMVAAARAQTGVAAVRGRAEALPLRTGSAALVGFHWSLHHTRWRSALREASRVLRGGGRLEIATPSRADITCSHMALWFPGMVPIDTARFPDLDEVAAHLGECSLELVHRVPAVESKARRAGDWVAAVEAGFVSTLQLLPAAEVAAGVARFRRRYPNPDEVVRYDVRYECLAAVASG